MISASLKTVIAASLALCLAPIASAATVSVSFSPELTEKFAETYGEREAEYLTRELTEDIDRALGKTNTSIARVDVIIEDAKPNRPTMKELGDRIGLSLQSFALGGAELSATAYDADGNTVAALDYDWYENHIEWAQYRSTWGDANRAFRRFATRLANDASTPG